MNSTDFAPLIANPKSAFIGLGLVAFAFATIGGMTIAGILITIIG